MKKPLLRYPVPTFLVWAALSTLHLPAQTQVPSAVPPSAPATGTVSGAATIAPSTAPVAPSPDAGVTGAITAEPAAAPASGVPVPVTTPAASPSKGAAAAGDMPAPATTKPDPALAPAKLKEAPPAAAKVAAIQADPNADKAAVTPAKPDAEMQAVLDAFMALGPKPIETLTAKEARKQPTIADAVMAILKKRDQKPLKEPVGDVDDRSISEGESNIKVRVYTPKGNGPFPVIVYYHGGGFVIADIDVYDGSARALSNAAGAIVVSAEYRHGPEHKYPAAHEDAFAAYQWVVKNAAKLKGDPMKIAVAGESAGGNLAAHVTLMAREKKMQAPVHQVLVYPVVDGKMDTPSYLENANAKPLNAAMMKWFFENYTKPEDAQDPMLTVLNADLAGLPPATIITAQIDPLRSEGEAYGKKLMAAGVQVNHVHFDGVAHEFFGTGAVVSKGKEAVTAAGNDLVKAFSGTNPPVLKEAPPATTEAAPPTPSEKAPKLIRDKTVNVE